MRSTKWHQNGTKIYKMRLRLLGNGVVIFSPQHCFTQTLYLLKTLLANILVRLTPLGWHRVIMAPLPKRTYQYIRVFLCFRHEFVANFHGFSWIPKLWNTNITDFSLLHQNYQAGILSTEVDFTQWVVAKTSMLSILRPQMTIKSFLASICIGFWQN